MAKSFDNSVYDNGLSGIISRAAAASPSDLKLVVCSAAPASFAEASTLHDGTPGKFRVSDEIELLSGDLTLQDRAGGGREIVVAAKTGQVSVTLAAGNDLHVAIYDSANSILVAVTDETTDQALTAGNPLNLPSFALGFGAPA